MLDIAMRSCNKCRQDKPSDLENFPRNRKLLLGIGYTCKPCDAERKRQVRRANPAVEQARIARHAAKDPDAFRAKAAARQQAYRERNPDAVKASKRKQLQEHPERNLEWVNRYRARKLAATIEPVDYAAIAERDQNVCHICGIEVDLTVSTYHPMARTFDHVIPLSRGGSHSMLNVKIAHRLCNTRKNNRLIAQEVG